MSDNIQPVGVPKNRVLWATILAKTPLPPSWRPIGNPYAVPGGALIVVKINAAQQRSQRLRAFAVLEWDAVSGQLSIVGKPTPSNAEARARQATIAHAVAWMSTEELSAYLATFEKEDPGE